MERFERIRLLLAQAAGANGNDATGRQKRRARIIGRLEGVLAAQPIKIADLALGLIEQRFGTRDLDELADGPLVRLAETLPDMLQTARISLMPAYRADLPIKKLSPEAGGESPPRTRRRPKS